MAAWDVCRADDRQVVEIPHTLTIKVKYKSSLVVPIFHSITGVPVVFLLQNEVDGWVQLPCPSPLFIFNVSTIFDLGSRQAVDRLCGGPGILHS